ncbi:MAG TPA: LytTR family DNA-binding domain-containing protein [Ignavibacteriaceae bacterium]|nr:LytTR family DNA-binding domain-containing protein [Ignavibacteriaceae bacterium]
MKPADTKSCNNNEIGTEYLNLKSNNMVMKTGAKRSREYNSNGNGISATVERQSRIIPFKDNVENLGFKLKREGKSGKNVSKLEYDDRIFITVNSTSRFIKVSNIQCITAEKDYTYICTADDKKLLVLRPMIEWESRLPGKYFARIHRSTIVNLDYVEKVEKWFNYAYNVYITGWDEPFQMSRRYASKIKERFR